MLTQDFFKAHNSKRKIHTGPQMKFSEKVLCITYQAVASLEFLLRPAKKLRAYTARPASVRISA